MGTGLAMHWRYTKSSPEVEARVRSNYNSFAPRIRLEWTPGMYYYMNGNRKINVGSFFPTFMLDYERGIKVLKNSGTYERIEGSVEQVIRLKMCVHWLIMWGLECLLTSRICTLWIMRILLT